MTNEIWRGGVVELTDGFRTGGPDPVEVLEAFLERIGRLNPALNAIVTLDEPGARDAAEASAARYKAGAPLSPIDGLPLTIKDNLLVKGMRATWGSLAYAEFVPDHDEVPIERLRAAGAVFVGKTNVPELTLEGYTNNRLFGVTRNPHDLRLTPGGSSGGAVASVAAGLVPAAIGTDGGGSIRRPACHTGLVGFKPSVGHVARGDGFPEILHDLEVVGPIARSVADVLALDQVLAGPDTRDRRSEVPRAVPLGRHSPKMRILYVPHFDDAPLDPEIRAATDAAAAFLADKGHIVETGPVFFDRARLDEIWRVIGRAGTAWLFGRNRRLDDGAQPAIAAMARDGHGLTARDYVEALTGLAEVRRDLAPTFRRYDLVLTPTAAALPWPAEEVFPRTIDGREAGPRGHAVYTGWVNVLGQPAIQMPLARSAAGLPIGGQFVAGFGADRGLLLFARAFEAEWGFGWRWPAMAEF